MAEVGIGKQPFKLRFNCMPLLFGVQVMIGRRLRR